MKRTNARLSNCHRLRGRTVNEKAFFNELSHPVDADVAVERDQTLRHGIAMRRPELLMAAERRGVEHSHSELVVGLDRRSAAAAPGHEASRGHRQRQNDADEHQRREDGGHSGSQVDHLRLCPSSRLPNKPVCTVVPVYHGRSTCPVTSPVFPSVFTQSVSALLVYLAGEVLPRIQSTAVPVYHWRPQSRREAAAR